MATPEASWKRTSRRIEERFAPAMPDDSSRNWPGWQGRLSTWLSDAMNSDWPEEPVITFWR